MVSTYHKQQHVAMLSPDAAANVPAVLDDCMWLLSIVLKAYFPYSLRVCKNFRTASDEA